MPVDSEPRWRILARTDPAQAKKRAKDLLEAYRRHEPDARRLFRDFHHDVPESAAARLADAQLVYARAHDFPSWPRFMRGIQMFNAIAADDPARVLELLRRYRALLHERVNGVSSNWGAPLACAAQLGSRKVFDALLPIPDQDLQTALDRAILKGRTDMARDLIDAGAIPDTAAALGPCETLNVAGLEFLARLGVPLTDENGNALAPIGMLLEGYFRDPAGKHACLAFFEEQGIAFPQTPVMAFHRGRLDELRKHLATDPGLLDRRFSYREIYPLDLGCHEDETLGLHGTPLHGCTLLHMAIDFDEEQIVHWLIEAGADVNATAAIDREGFGGHTPLFNTVVSQAYRSGRQRHGSLAKRLLACGATPDARASIRKGIRFIADESVHVYRNVTALEYGRRFHARDWVNPKALDFTAAACTR